MRNCSDFALSHGLWLTPQPDLLALVAMYALLLLSGALLFTGMRQYERAGEGWPDRWKRRLIERRATIKIVLSMPVLLLAVAAPDIIRLLGQ